MFLHHVVPALIKLANGAVFVGHILPQLEDEHWLIAIILFAVLTFAVVVVWLRAACSNSQAMPLPEVDAADGYSEAPMCAACQIVIQEQSRHCTTCGYCVQNFDHHCTWLNRCIGGRNYKRFMWYLVLFTLHQILVMLLCLWSFVQGQRMHEQIAQALPLLVEIVITTPVLCYLVDLLLFHTFLRRKQLTAYEYFMLKNERTRLKQRLNQAQLQLIRKNTAQQLAGTSSRLPVALTNTHSDTGSTNNSTSKITGSAKS